MSSLFNRTAQLLIKQNTNKIFQILNLKVRGHSSNPNDAVLSPKQPEEQFCIL